MIKARAIVWLGRGETSVHVTMAAPGDNDPLYEWRCAMVTGPRAVALAMYHKDNARTIASVCKPHRRRRLHTAHIEAFVHEACLPAEAVQWIANGITAHTAAHDGISLVDVITCVHEVIERECEQDFVLHGNDDARTDEAAAWQTYAAAAIPTIVEPIRHRDIDDVALVSCTGARLVAVLLESAVHQFVVWCRNGALDETVPPRVAESGLLTMHKRQGFVAEMLHKSAHAMESGVVGACIVVVPFDACTNDWRALWTPEAPEHCRPRHENVPPLLNGDSTNGKRPTNLPLCNKMLRMLQTRLALPSGKHLRWIFWHVGNREDTTMGITAMELLLRGTTNYAWHDKLHEALWLPLRITSLDRLALNERIQALLEPLAYPVLYGADDAYREPLSARVVTVQMALAMLAFFIWTRNRSDDTHYDDEMAWQSYVMRDATDARLNHSIVNIDVECVANLMTRDPDKQAVSSHVCKCLASIIRHITSPNATMDVRAYRQQDEDLLRTITRQVNSANAFALTTKRYKTLRAKAEQSIKRREVLLTVRTERASWSWLVNREQAMRCGCAVLQVFDEISI